VFLSAEQEQRYYSRVCNSTIWPLFHYFAHRIDADARAWSAYVEVNRLFADAILAELRPESVVWVHDFHLMLVPGMLRAARPELQIGFFLHIPFPSSEVYRILPMREQILAGLLGADYLGFHTSDYARHFRSACLRVLGLESEPDSIQFEGRQVTLGVDPIGIDTGRFDEALADPETERYYRELERRYDNTQLLLGIERLDYTKGIPQKLRAFDRFLEQSGRGGRRATLLQVLVPSRLQTPDYQELKVEIEREVGRINGKHSRPGVTPVEYMHRSLTMPELVALYRFADLALVTPVRDGMNLVAQEFVYCQGARGPGERAKGMLVLSEFAGAAHVLVRSLLTNPWNADQTVAMIRDGLAMPAAERAVRIESMAEKVAEMRSAQWAANFLRRCERAHERDRSRQRAARLGPEAAEKLVARFRSARRRRLFLDYDGTLREITTHPDQADPSRAVLDLLRALAAVPQCDVHVVSGRHRRTLDAWLGELPVWLCAEHGLASRAPGGDWITQEVDLSWLPAAERLLRQVADEVPGTLVERKPAGIAWHYREAEPDYGAWRAREVLTSLRDMLAGAPAEAIPGRRVIEVRSAEVDKGTYARRAMADLGADEVVFGIGDDRTDLDLYEVLPPDGVSIHVGDPSVASQYVIDSPAAVRSLLWRFAGSVPGD
jgi:trehalose 6-phosphate synthase/phosphatase